jgi:L-rhamnose isomerase
MISNNNDADLDDENIEVDENQASNDSSPSTNTNKNTSNTDVEIIDTITATTSAAQTVIPNPNQSVEVKREKENITKIINEVANPKFVIPLLPRSASADSKSKQGQLSLGANAFKKIKEKAATQKTAGPKKPKSITKIAWEKMNDEQKREAAKKDAKDDFNATNAAAHAAVAPSRQIKRQASMSEIDKDFNKKAANKDDGQSQASSLSFYSENETE